MDKTYNSISEFSVQNEMSEDIEKNKISDKKDLVIASYMINELNKKITKNS